MPKRIDLTGQVFGRLTVVGLASNAAGRLWWRCSCTCGSFAVIRGDLLKSGHASSCGCYRKARVTSHGMSCSSEYSSWRGIVQRCCNPKSQSYADYGGRGITVCDSWLKFEDFYADMGPRPSKDHSIDRKDNNGPYCKDNCRWATQRDQNNNKRSTRLVSHNGKEQSVSQWAASAGLHVTVLIGRLNLGWPMDKALTEPVKKRRSRDTSR